MTVILNNALTKNRADGIYLTLQSAGALYLLLDASNDPITGQLRIEPGSGNIALSVNKDISIVGGQKLIFDGD